MATILITGGTGMIGSALSSMLTDKGHSVILLTRDTTTAPLARPGVSYAHWDLNKMSIDSKAVAAADHIIHLAGAGVADKRWTTKRKKEIVESRTKSSELIVRALQETPNQVKTVVSASGIGWYGADPTIPNPTAFVETDPVDDDFLGETCRLWEESIQGAAGAGVPSVEPSGDPSGDRRGGRSGRSAGITGAAGTRDEGAGTKGRRLVIFRIGPVLAQQGGALAEFKKPVKLGVAAILGSGKQMMSWIHIEDLCRLFLRAIEDPTMTGTYNAVAPQPATNKTITMELAKRMKGRYYVPVYVPTFLLKLIIGELSVEVLKSATVSAEKLRRAGFQFIFPSIQSALDQLLKE